MVQSVMICGEGHAASLRSAIRPDRDMNDRWQGSPYVSNEFSLAGQLYS